MRYDQSTIIPFMSFFKFLTTRFKAFLSLSFDFPSVSTITIYKKEIRMSAWLGSKSHFTFISLNHIVVINSKANYLSW